MKLRWNCCVLTLSVLASLGLPQPARAQSAETIVTWNRILLATLVTPGAQPPTVFVTRPAAIVSVAVFDAVNSFDRLYQPYATQGNVTAGASRDAAAAQAAHDALVALFPAQRATFDAALVTSLAGIPADAARDGALVGAVAAQATLALRANDGWNQTPPPYCTPDASRLLAAHAAGECRRHLHPLPLRAGLRGSGRTSLPDGGAASPHQYALCDGFQRNQERGQREQHDAHGGSDADVAPMGRRQHDHHRAERVEPGLGDLARTRNLSGLDTARGFALLNMVVHDALLTSFSGKFLYGLWRPVTAIREAGRDDNPATEADPAWLPLLTTPPYPGHPGNMACIGSSEAQTMARVLGQDNIPFSVTWVVTNGPAVTRPYNGFRQLADEEADSRIWGGDPLPVRKPGQHGSVPTARRLRRRQHAATALSVEGRGLEPPPSRSG